MPRDEQFAADDGPRWERKALGEISHSVLVGRGKQILERLKEAGVVLPRDHRLARAIRLLDVPEGEAPKAGDHQRARELAAATHATLEALAIIEAHRAHGPQRHLFTTKRLRHLVQGRLALPDGLHDDDANRRFETYVGALLVMGGFTLTDAEPDWHLLYLDGEHLGLAVKRINSPSERAIRERLEQAERQIASSGLRGLVALNVDALTDSLPVNVGPEQLGLQFDALVDDALRTIERLADRQHVIGAYMFGTAIRFQFSSGGVARLEAAAVHKVIPLGTDEELPRLGRYLERMQRNVRLALVGVTRLAGPNSGGTTGLPHLD